MKRLTLLLTFLAPAISQAQLVNPATATPDTVCSGTLCNLNGTCPDSLISWYDHILSMVPIGQSQSGENFAVYPTVTTAYYAEPGSPQPASSITFDYTGAVQTFEVPAGVTTIDLDVYGAQGGASNGGNGGLGGRVQAVIPVVAGQVLGIYVGGQPSSFAGGWNGGGNLIAANPGYAGAGGGASDIRKDGNGLANRIIVAGGGGGSTYYFPGKQFGGAGGGLIAGNGGGLGYGGTQTAGGAFSGSSCGSAGTLGLGGTGACSGYGGGGGGGYYGGGGGETGGGGGGSSYAGPGAMAVTHTQGIREGHGKIIISWSATRSVAAVQVLPIVPVSVTVTSNLNDLCAGNEVVLTATPTNAGTAPVYTWYRNTLVSGGTSPTYTFIPADQDSVRCTMDPGIRCPSVNPAVSNTVKINVLGESGIDSVILQATATTLCQGTYVKLWVNSHGCHPVNYTWQKNGVTLTNAHDTSLIINAAALSDSGDYRCIKSNSLGSDTSNTVKIVVIKTPGDGVSVTIVNLTDVLVAYTGNTGPSAVYTWNFSDGQILSGSGKGPYMIRYSDGGYRKVSLSITEGPCPSPVYYSPEFKVMIFEGQSFPFPAIDYGSAEFFDYNNDGFLDVIATGSNATRIYTNNGGLGYTQLQPALANLSYSNCAVGDYNNDGFSDILAFGKKNASYVTKLYMNMGNCTFSESSCVFPGVLNGSAKWFDYDNDGFQDILLSGEDSTYNPLTKLFRNSRNGQFVEVATPILNLTNSAMAVCDYNKDGFQDVIISGNAGPNRFAKVYKNTNGTFTDAEIPITGVNCGGVDWGDFNNDGNMDFAISGMKSNPVQTSSNCLDYYQSVTLKFYLNNGNGQFSLATEKTMKFAYARSSLKWGDFDSDGDPDLAISGLPGIGSCVVSIGGGGNPLVELKRSAPRIYRNDGNNNFTDIQVDIPRCWTNDSFHFWCVGTWAGFSITWGDFNNDGKLDILRTGNGSGTLSTNIYKHGLPLVNSIPGMPGSTVTQVSADTVRFSWQSAMDLQTPPAALTYNIRVGTTPGGSEIMSPLSTASGVRKIVGTGNAGQNSGWALRDLQPGTYYWSVQAIDNAFAGGPFAAEQTFTINPVIPAVVSVPDDTLLSGESQCYQALQTLTVPAAGGHFRVENGGEATLVSGQNILLQPSVKVDSGGYLQARITTTNEYCPLPMKPAGIANRSENPFPREDGSDISHRVTTRTGIVAYPNPTTGQVTIRCPGWYGGELLKVGVMNLFGEVLVAPVTGDGNTRQVDLSSCPPGMYLLEVATERGREMVKVVRQ